MIENISSCFIFCLKDQDESSQESAVKYLVEKGADINCQDTYGCTPLHYACMRGSDTAVRDLLSFTSIEIDVSLSFTNLNVNLRLK